MKKNKKPLSSYDLYQSIRKDWGTVSPVTKVDKDKSKYTRKQKHKKKEAFLCE